MVNPQLSDRPDPPGGALARRPPRGIYVIGLWLLFSTVPGFWWCYSLGMDVVMSPLAVITLAYNLTALVCAAGLFFKKELARRGTVWLFSVYFIWSIFVVHFLIGPSIRELAFWLAQFVTLSTPAIQRGLIVLLIVYILWPVIVVFYLTYPGVKMAFYKKRAAAR